MSIHDENLVETFDPIQKICFKGKEVFLVTDILEDSKLRVLHLKSGLFEEAEIDELVFQ